MQLKKHTQWTKIPQKISFLNDTFVGFSSPLCSFFCLIVSLCITFYGLVIFCEKEWRGEKKRCDFFVLDHKFNGNIILVIFFCCCMANKIIRSSCFTSLCRTRDCDDKWKVRIRHIALLCGTLDKIPAEMIRKYVKKSNLKKPDKKSNLLLKLTCFHRTKQRNVASDA